MNWIYDKHGNKIQVPRPTYSNGKPVKQSGKTKTGKLGRSVGYHGFGNSLQTKNNPLLPYGVSG